MLPGLKEINVNRDMVNEFRGYNHNIQINQNEFYDMRNMTSSFFPALSPRGCRGVVMDASDIDGLVAKEQLCWAKGNKFYYNGQRIGDLTEFHNADGTVKRVDRQFVSMGAYLLIFPDKKYFNSAAWAKGESEFEFGDNKLPVFGSLEHTFQQTAKASFILSRLDGVTYDPNVTVDGVDKGTQKYTVADKAPSEPANGDLWLDSSGKKLSLKQYAEATEQWVGIATTYLRIQCLGIGVGVSEYDTVSISGCTNKDFDGDFLVYGRGDDYIIIAGILDEVFEQGSGLKLEMKVPDMDFVTEGENRIWGCNSAKNEIYACKLGNPWNWSNYMGISTDSYAATVGSDGDFTGACTYLGYLFFFKEETIHRVYGTMPANYTVQEIKARGIERGSEKSAVIVNEILFYKSRDGIMSFDGSLPESISYPLGIEAYHNAVAGGCGNKYYVSMADSGGIYRLFVFDQRTGLWHVEDNTQARSFCRLKNELYYIDAGDLKLKTINGSQGTGGANYEGATKEEPFSWSVESGNWGTDSPDKKYISKILLRLSAEPKTRIKVSVQYDSCGYWDELIDFTAMRLGTVPIAVIPRRCDHLRLRISGVGDCKILSISKSTEQGSEF